MSYQVIARKYRPAGFETVIGQEHVTRTLANGIKRGRIGHAYLFCGPRGVGKTSIARIFSKALNCVDGPTPAPCHACTSCLEITAGTSLAVREIDGASHNSVDNVRELIDSFRSLPPPGSKYKIYIIDEVHMLSTSAFNALLKSLEEPPAHTVFILATTDPHKIPDTVISRCQRHDFKSLSRQAIEQCLCQVAEREQLKIQPEVLNLMARLADGSLRDAQSLLERVASFSEGEITAAETAQILGAVDQETLLKLSRAILAHSCQDALAILSAAFEVGIDPAIFLREFVSHWRELLIGKFSGAVGLKAVGVCGDVAAELLEVVQAAGSQDMQDLVWLAREGADAALRSSYPRYALESLVVRMAAREPVRDLGELLSKLKLVLSKEGGANSSSAAVGGRESKSDRVEEKNLKTVEAVSRNRVIDLPKASAPETEASDRAGAFIAWPELVKELGSRGEPMLLEHLKRLSVVKFGPGVLEARGPELSIKYLKFEGNHKKLQHCLNAAAGGKNWLVDLKVGSSKGLPETGSIKEQELLAEQDREKQTAESVNNHPMLRSIKSAFPGSKLQNLKSKPGGAA